MFKIQQRDEMKKDKVYIDKALRIKPREYIYISQIFRILDAMCGDIYNLVRTYSDKAIFSGAGK